MLNLGHQSTTGIVRAQIVLIRLGRAIRGQSHRFHPINPARLPIDAGIIAIVYMRIAAARYSRLGVVLVGEQAATVVDKTLPITVFEMMSLDLAEVVVRKLFD